MSTILVNNIKDTGNNTLLTSDGSGNVTASSSLASSVASVGSLNMTPAFYAYAGSTQSVGDAAYVKAQINTEVFDTDGYYDSSTNYRFTPLVAGKYYVFAALNHHGGSGNNVQFGGTYIYKNGGNYAGERNNANGSYPEEAMNVFVSCVVDMNGSSDYLELYGQTNTISGSNGQWLFDNLAKACYFGAYRIIGA